MRGIKRWWCYLDISDCINCRWNLEVEKKKKRGGVGGIHFTSIICIVFMLFEHCSYTSLDCLCVGIFLFFGFLLFVVCVENLLCCVGICYDMKSIEFIYLFLQEFHIPWSMKFVDIYRVYISFLLGIQFPVIPFYCK